MNVNHAKLQKKFDSRTVLGELPQAYSFAFQFYKKSHKDKFSKFAHETHVSYFIGNFRDNYFRLHYLEETLSLP